MSADIAVIGAGAFVLAVLLTGLVRRLALAHGVIDFPNERSSHKRATPRGGGISMVIAASIGWGVLAWRGELRPGMLWGLVGGGAAVAFVGFLDDRRTVPPLIRFAVHAAAAAWTLAWVGDLPAMQFGEHIVSFGWGGYVLAVLGIVWTLNLFNFMDGIDGIATSEALFIGLGGAWLTWLGGLSASVPAAAAVFAAACAGFLVWNWPPAKIFMGDVGSGYLGFVIAVLGMDTAQRHPAAMWVWLILGGVFFIDSTVTLVRRGLRGAPMSVAHRSHAYQWLAREWGSHRRVTLWLMAINVCWLLPCALVAMYRPDWAFGLVVLALSPLILLVLFGGAGRPEGPLS